MIVLYSVVVALLVCVWLFLVCILINNHHAFSPMAMHASMKTNNILFFISLKFGRLIQLSQREPEQQCCQIKRRHFCNHEASNQIFPGY